VAYPYPRGARCKEKALCHPLLTIFPHFPLEKTGSMICNRFSTISILVLIYLNYSGRLMPATDTIVARLFPCQLIGFLLSIFVAVTPVIGIWCTLWLKLLKQVFCYLKEENPLNFKRIFLAAKQ
jgi:hypothetical protein